MVRGRESSRAIDAESRRKLDELFGVFETANGNYPNSNPGIITELGYAYFKSGLEPILFAKADLTKEQIDSIATKMSEMHRAAGVSQVAEGERDAHFFNTIPRERLVADWERFKQRVFVASVMYSEAALTAVGKGPKRTLHEEIFDGTTIHTGSIALDLADYLEREPWLRTELLVFFETLHKALHSPAVEKEYAKLRHFLTYKKHGKRIPTLTRLTKSLNRRDARQPVIDAFQKKASELISQEERLSVKPAPQGLGVWGIR